MLRRSFSFNSSFLISIYIGQRNFYDIDTMLTKENKIWFKGRIFSTEIVPWRPTSLFLSFSPEFERHIYRFREGGTVVVSPGTGGRCCSSYRGHGSVGPQLLAKRLYMRPMCAMCFRSQLLGSAEAGNLTDRTSSPPLVPVCRCGGLRLVCLFLLDSGQIPASIYPE